MEAICQVSLDAITQNYKFFQNRVKSAQIIPVVKANAYGHGVIDVTKHLFHELGVTFFAVATLEEARETIEQELTEQGKQLAVETFIDFNLRCATEID